MAGQIADEGTGLTHPVPAAGLGSVERPIGMHNECGRTIRAGFHTLPAIGRRHSHADSNRLSIPSLFLDGTPDALSSLHRAVGIRPGEDQYKLLASIACGRVGRSGGVVENRCHPPQDLITGRMSKRVVKLLKAVNVDHHYR